MEEQLYLIEYVPDKRWAKLYLPPNLSGKYNRSRTDGIKGDYGCFSYEDALAIIQFTVQMSGSEWNTLLRAVECPKDWKEQEEQRKQEIERARAYQEDQRKRLEHAMKYL